jgi:hypothetical protein
VDARELDAKIFTKLIDAFAHDHSPCNFGNFYLAPRVCCLIWINLIDTLGRFAHEAGPGARVTDPHASGGHTRISIAQVQRACPTISISVASLAGSGQCGHRVSSFGIGATHHS